MSTEPKNIRLDAAIFQQLQERAAREGKPLDVVANETVQLGLKADQTSRLRTLMEDGQRRATQTHPGLTDEDIVDIVHKRRGL